MHYFFTENIPGDMRVMISQAEFIHEFQYVCGLNNSFFMFPLFARKHNEDSHPPTQSSL
jgi:hypothetical protein